MSEEICASCARQVSSFFLFKQRCEESDAALRNRFGVSPYKKPYSIQEEEKLSCESLYSEDPAIDVIIKSEFPGDELKSETTHELECTTCSKSFPSSNSLTRHKKCHDEPPKEVEVIESNVIEISPELVLETGSKHADDTSSGNEIEEIVITGSNNLNLFNESLDKHACKYCGFVAGTEDDVKNHDCESKKGVLECSVCRKTFGKSSHLNRHLKIHSGVKPHVCVLCGKGFARGEQLTNHMNMHSGVKPHVCKICSKGLPRNYKP